MKKIIPLLIAISFIVGCTNDESINRQCSIDYPHSFIDKMNCINSLEKEKAIRVKKDAELKAEEEKEASARSCIANDLSRMEGLAKRIYDATNEPSSLESLKKIYKSILGRDGVIQPSDDDIKENLLITEIPTKCESKFEFLINVRANQNGQLLWLRQWANTSPEGYISGLHYEFSKEFEKIRRQKADAEADALMKKVKDDLEATRLANLAEEKRNSEISDPCAPNLTKAERLVRLGKFGVIRQESSDTYLAGNHRVVFFSWDNSLIYCR